MQKDRMTVDKLVKQKMTKNSESAYNNISIYY